MQQQRFADESFEQYRKLTRRERFLDKMNRVVPWADLVAAIEPVYPKAEGPGRTPVGVERMLRLHCLQQWFTLSDPAVEDALYDSRAMRQFVGIDLGREPVPDETTICKFQHLFRLQAGRRQCARHPEAGARGDLRHGSRLSRLRAAVPAASGTGLLRDSRQVGTPSFIASIRLRSIAARASSAIKPLR